MKQLPNEFDGRSDQRGFRFRVVKRNGLVCLLEKRKAGKVNWEVAILRTLAQMTWPDGRVTEAHEAMPSPEQWGVCGWSLASFERAEEIFEREEGGSYLREAFRQHV